MFPGRAPSHLATRPLCGIILLLALLIACSSGAPTAPHTPLPTRAQPEDVAHQLLSESLSELEYDLTQARSLLAFMAKSPQVLGDSASACDTFVTGLLKTNTRYTQIGVSTPNGVLYCESQSRGRQVSIADRLYYSRALTERGFVVGEYVIGRVTLAPSLGLAYPIIDETNHLRGVAIAPLRLGWLASRFAELNLPVTGEIVIIDTYGNLILRDPDANDWFGRNISDTPLGRAMLEKVRGTGEFAGADGETRYYTFASPHAANNNLIVAVGIKR